MKAGASASAFAMEHHLEEGEQKLRMNAAYGKL